jgi:GNAT superfamily N-acetyltransferase
MLMRKPGLYACVVRVGHVCEVQRLTRRATRCLCAGDYSPQQIESMLTHLLPLDVQLIRDGTYFAATDGERIIGVGAWSFRRSQPCPHAGDDALDPARDAAHIRGIFVEPAHARRGVGRMLLKLCEAAAAEAGFWKLELLSTVTAEPLYRACGFALTEPRETTLPDGVTIDTSHMTKRLEDRRRFNIPRA